MIDQGVLSRIRNAVCAVGYLTVPLKKFLEESPCPYFQVVGTGFLIREMTAITNRHVIQELLRRQANLGFPSSQFFLSFVVPADTSTVQMVVRMVREFTVLQDPQSDVGFLEFAVGNEGRHQEQFRNISPVGVGTCKDLKVTEEIAICGYPYGNLILQTDGGRVYRWGPVTQQGFISSLSPFDSFLDPDMMLLDIRTAGGMSGAPVFRPSTGEVVGIHHSGVEATIAMGLPLTQSKVNEWLNAYDRQRDEETS